MTREQASAEIIEWLHNMTKHGVPIQAAKRKALVVALEALQDDYGAWEKEINDEGKIEGWHCSNCYDTTGFHTTQTSEFCPRCDARMEFEEV